VTVELKPSFLGKFFFYAVLVCITLAMSMLIGPWLWIATAVGGCLVWRYQYLLSMDGHSSLKWDTAGWHYKHQDDWEQVTLHQATIWSWLLVLNVSRLNNGQHFPIVVFPHQCDPEQLRYLRVLLRHQTVFG